MNAIIRHEKIEGLGIFFASAISYWALGFNFLWFFLLLFSIDIFMIGYFINNKTGARIYNLGHSYLFPSLLLAFGVAISLDAITWFSIIWIAHIGLDRTLGFGLKLDSGFRDTHLGRIGKNKL